MNEVHFAFCQIQTFRHNMRYQRYDETNLPTLTLGTLIQPRPLFHLLFQPLTKLFLLSTTDSSRSWSWSKVYNI